MKDKKTPAPKFKHKLGIRVKHTVTGFEGIVTVREQHLHMCNRYNVTPEGTSADGKLKDVYSFDEDALKVLDKTPIEEAPEPDFKYGLGFLAKDSVSLLEGVVIARCQHLHLCNRYWIQPQGPDEKGARKDFFTVDEAAIVPLETEARAPVTKQDRGGPPMLGRV